MFYDLSYKIRMIFSTLHHFRISSAIVSSRESFLQQFRKEYNALLKSSTADISEIPSRPFLGIPIIFQ